MADERDERIEIDTTHSKVQAAISFSAGRLRRAWLRKGDRERIVKVDAWKAMAEELAAIERDLGHFAVQLKKTEEEATIEFLEKMQARQGARRDQLLAEIVELEKVIHL